MEVGSRVPLRDRGSPKPGALSGTALAVQMVDRCAHLVGVPRRPVVGLRHPGDGRATACADDLHRETLRAVLLAQDPSEPVLAGSSPAPIRGGDSRVCSPSGEAVSLPTAWSGRRRQSDEGGTVRGATVTCPFWWTTDDCLQCMLPTIVVTVCGLRAARATQADSCRTRRRFPRSQRSSWCVTASTAACLRRAHSQTVATRQPACSRSWRFGRSRSMFASNLACQNSRRVLGVVAYGQPECRCQKQPCTRHTARNRRNTRSGVPGSLRSCRRNRRPRAWMARLRASSGRVFLLPIPAIMRERVARPTMSAIVVAGRSSEGTARQQATREVRPIVQRGEIRQRRAGPRWLAPPLWRLSRAGRGPSAMQRRFVAANLRQAGGAPPAGTGDDRAARSRLPKPRQCRVPRGADETTAPPPATAPYTASGATSNAGSCLRNPATTSIPSANTLPTSPEPSPAPPAAAVG